MKQNKGGILKSSRGYLFRITVEEKQQKSEREKIREQMLMARSSRGLSNNDSKRRAPWPPHRGYKGKTDNSRKEAKPKEPVAKDKPAEAGKLKLADAETYVREIHKIADPDFKEFTLAELEIGADRRGRPGCVLRPRTTNQASHQSQGKEAGARPRLLHLEPDTERLTTGVIRPRQNPWK